MSGSFRRIQVYFEKQGEALSLSHLGLMHAMEKALVASGLPVRRSEGKDPRPKASFPTALPQGMESRLEVMELQIREGFSLRSVLERLGPVLPPGTVAFDADALYPGEKWRVASITYAVEGAVEDLPGPEEIESLFSRDGIPVERRKKVVDLKPLLLSCRRETGRLTTEIAFTDRGTARPEDLLRALSRDPERFRIVKIGMTFRTTFGEKIEKRQRAQDSGQRLRDR